MKRKTKILASCALAVTMLAVPFAFAGCGDNTYTALFKDGDKVVATVEFKKGDKSLDLSKSDFNTDDGFSYTWDTFSLENKDLTIALKTGDGSADAPYYIRNAVNFETLLKNCLGEIGAKNYRLVSDIDLSTFANKDYSSGDFKGVLDGDNHSIKGFKNANFIKNDGAVFERAENAVFKNINLKAGREITSLVGIAGGEYVTFDNVDVQNEFDSTFVTNSDNNESSYICHSFAKKLLFKDCQDSAKYTSISAYNGIFLGGYVNTASYAEAVLTYENCQYEGVYESIGNVGMLYGNGFYAPKAGNIVVDDATVNNGIIKAAKASILCSKTFETADKLNAALGSSLDTTNKGSGELTTRENKDYKVTVNTDKNIVISNGDNNKLISGTYKVMLSAFALGKIDNKTEGSRTIRISLQLDVPFTADDSTTSIVTDMKAYTFVDTTSYGKEIASTQVWTDLTGYNIKYFVDSDTNQVVFDFTAALREGEAFTLNKAAEINVVVYDLNNTLDAYIVK